MSNCRKPVRVSHEVTTATITVTLPLTHRVTFPNKTRFALRPNVIDVEVIREENKIGFVLTLNANNLPECRSQLSRILPLNIVMSIIDGPKANHTIEVSGQILTATTGALRQIAKFSHTRPHSDAQTTAVPVIPGAVSENVANRRQTQALLSRLADETGRIPAARLPRRRSPQLVTAH